MVTVQKAVRVDVIECYKCGSWTALTTSQHERFLENGETFYCAIGHGQSYRNSKVTVLTKELEEQRRRTSQALSHVDELLLDKVARKKELTALKRRTDNGVCPHCQRTFKQVTRHITKKHPDVHVATGPVIKD